MALLKPPNGKPGIPPRGSSCCNHDADCAVHAEPHDRQETACTCPEMKPLYRHRYRAPAPHKNAAAKSCT
jgi:hypothetical protein